MNEVTEMSENLTRSDQTIEKVIDLLLLPSACNTLSINTLGCFWTSIPKVVRLSGFAMVTSSTTKRALFQGIV